MIQAVNQLGARWRERVMRGWKLLVCSEFIRIKPGNDGHVGHLTSPHDPSHRSHHGLCALRVREPEPVMPQNLRTPTAANCIVVQVGMDARVLAKVWGEHETIVASLTFVLSQEAMLIAIRKV